MPSLAVPPTNTLCHGRAFGTASLRTSPLVPSGRRGNSTSTIRRVPTFQFCRFTIAVSLTHKAKNNTNITDDLVQSYAAVADARPAPCQEFIWLADSIARDTLAE